MFPFASPLVTNISCLTLHRWKVTLAPSVPKNFKKNLALDIEPYAYCNDKFTSPFKMLRKDSIYRMSQSNEATHGDGREKQRQDHTSTRPHKAIRGKNGILIP